MISEWAKNVLRAIPGHMVTGAPLDLGDVQKAIKEAVDSQPDDFRSHTCGECAWKIQALEDGYAACRRSEIDLIQKVDEFNANPACPAYVPRKEG